MKAWPLLTLLVIAGCGSRSEDRDIVAYRGPQVSIDVRPVGRAERFAPGPAPKVEVPPVAKPDELQTDGKDGSEEPKPKPRRRHAKLKPVEEKPKPKVEKPKEVLPPDEDYYPSQHRNDDDDFNPGLYRVPDRRNRGGGDGGDGEGQ